MINYSIDYDVGAQKIVESYGLIGIVTTMQNEHKPCCCYI